MSFFHRRWCNSFLILLLAYNYFTDTTQVDALTTAALGDRATLLGLLPQSGFICDGPTQVNRLCDACYVLENVGSASASIKEEDLDGNWRLRFASASPYGLMRSLPEDITALLLQGFPTPIRKLLIDNSILLPLSIEQRIHIADRQIVNYIELAPWPKNDATSNLISGAMQQTGPLGKIIQTLQEATVRLELDHKFALKEASDGANIIELNLETVRRSLVSAGDALPQFIPRESIYDLPAPFNFSGSFETTYVDKSVRIARGTSFPFINEVFVFERVGMDLQDDLGDAECELVFEKDGELPVMLCDNIDDADYIPSD